MHMTLRSCFAHLATLLVPGPSLVSISACRSIILGHPSHAFCMRHFLHSCWAAGTNWQPGLLFRLSDPQHGFIILSDWVPRSWNSPAKGVGASDFKSSSTFNNNIKYYVVDARTVFWLLSLNLSRGSNTLTYKSTMQIHHPCKVTTTQPINIESFLGRLIMANITGLTNCN